MSSSKPRITISVDSPAKEVSVTVTVKETDAGEERLESMAGSSGDRLAVKVGGKNSKKVDKSEGYGKASQSGHEVAKSLGHEAARDHHDDGKELDGWEEVLGEESDPHPSSYSPPVVEPPSSASYATSSPSPAREGFGVGEIFALTRKTGERLHRATIRTHNWSSEAFVTPVFEKGFGAMTTSWHFRSSTIAASTPMIACACQQSM